MAEIDPVILQLRADVDKYLADLSQTTTRADDLLEKHSGAVDRLERAINQSADRMVAAFERASNSAQSEATAIQAAKAAEEGATRKAAAAAEAAEQVQRNAEEKIAEVAAKAAEEVEKAKRQMAEAATDAAKTEARTAQETANAADRAAKEKLQAAQEAKRASERAAKAAEKAARDEKRAHDLAAKAAERAAADKAKAAREAETAMARSSASIGGHLRTLAASLASYFTGRELIKLSDSFTRLQNNIRVAGIEGENMKAVQDRLFESAQRYGVGIEGLSSLFSGLVQASQELGASQDEVFRVTDAVSASLKIMGVSAGEAGGAMLQLRQLFQGQIVQAQEYNSLIDGMYPLLQAVAAGSDRWKGSVGALTRDVKDSSVTTQEFFQALLNGAHVTEERAAKATLTLSAGVTTLTNALTVYFGEADKANGVSAALGETFGMLADNLDTLVPALAIVGVGLGVGVVTNAVRAQIALVGVAGAAARAKIALLGAFGGPVGIAITAIGAALIYAATQGENAAEAAARLGDETEQLKAKNEALAKRLRDAGVAIEGFGREANRAAREVDTLSISMDHAIGKARGFMVAMASVARAQAELNQIDANIERLQRPSTTFGPARWVEDALGLNDNTELIASLQEKRIAKAAEVELRALAIANGIDPDEAPSAGGTATAPGTPEKPKPKPKGRTGPSAEEIEDRFHAEVASLMAQHVSARASMARSAEEQADLELRNVELARIRTKASIKADRDYSDAQKEQLLAQLEGVAEEERRAVEFNMRRQLEQEAQGLADERFRAEQDQLRVQYDLADTQAERKELALRIVDLEQRHAEALLESVIASETASKADKERARVALDALQQIAGARRESASRSNETEVERYLRHLDKTPEQINEAVDSIKIDGLEALNDGLVDAIRGVKDLGDVFESVADQIIADLLRIAIQRAIVQPLASAIFGGVAGGFGGGGGGGALGLGSLTNGRLPGRASGGRVQAGTLYRVNEGSSPGRVEGFVPEVNGNIIPLGRMNAPSGGGRDSGTATVRLELSGDIDARIQQVSGPVAIEVVRASAPSIVDASAKEAMARSRRPRL